jgi:DNA mismatch repair ATPase MutS
LPENLTMAAESTEEIALREVPDTPRPLTHAERGRLGGRKPGQLNKATHRVRTIAQLLVEDEEYLKLLRVRIKAGDAPHMEILLWHYAYGKPKDVVEHTGEVQIGRVIREIVVPKDPVRAAARQVHREVMANGQVDAD